MSKKPEKEVTSVEMILDRFEGSNAVLISDKTEFLAPIQFLPKSISEGEVVVVTFATCNAEKNRREMKAKEILNEILHI